MRMYLYLTSTECLLLAYRRSGLLSGFSTGRCDQSACDAGQDGEWLGCHSILATYRGRGGLVQGLWHVLGTIGHPYGYQSDPL